ncbi:hypothetical protein SUDANB96_05452 [Streptomyces sp. enrichment culture]
MAERTERETVFAKPDGETFLLRKSIVPVRVKMPGGGWTEPDATLVKRPDGSIGPKAAAVDLSFSAGGDGKDLVTIGEEGQSVTMGWPGTLPEPRLDGQRAIYENVRPDVNLILTATVEGFRQVLEIETLQAAQDPALASLEYSLDANGLRTREGAVGSVEAIDSNGKVVFRSPSARMWNSAGQETSDSGSTGLHAQAAAAMPIAGPRNAPTELEPRPAGPVEEGDPLAGPGPGDEAAVMDTDVTTDSLTVTPDADLLAGTTSAELPLYIDPSVELNESERTVLSSDGDAFYNFSGGDNGMSVGRCSSAVIGGYMYYCTSGSPYTNRMYFEFTPGKLKGKHILDATFAVTETWSFSCDARTVDLKRTDGISSSSRWPGPGGPNADNSWDQMGDRSVSAGRGGLCDPSQPRAPIEFNDNPSEPDENLTPTVRAFADGKFASLTLMLKAHDESDPIAWKRFDDDAVIDVTYVGKPTVPTEYGLETGTSQLCSKDASEPTMWSDPTPNLAATPQTMAGGEESSALRVFFDVDVRNTDGSWSDAKEPSTGSYSPTSGYVRDGVDQNKVWDAALVENRLHRYRAFTRSYYNGGANSLVSGGTSFCYFTVDGSRPQPPSITFNSTYSACLPSACVAAGGPNVSGQVTFGPAAGSRDVNIGYTYKLSTDSTWRPWKEGSTVKVTLTPVDSGTVTLDVRAKDAYGRYGDNRVRFLVKEGDGPVGRWTFNEASGAAVDVSAADAAQRDDATIHGGVRVDRGRRGQILENGITGEDKALELGGQRYAATSGKVLETQASYTVAAWVRLKQTDITVTALGQDGTYYSPFFLGYCASVDRWCLRLADADAATTSLNNQRVDSLGAPQTNVWTHLAAVIDTGRSELILYVNGVEQGRDDLTTGAWSAGGPLQIGRVKYKGSYVDYFPGDIDEVAVWQQAQGSLAIAKDASPEDVGGKAYTELVAQFSPNGASGTSLQDEAGYGSKLGLSSGASLDGEALVLNGTSGAAATAQPLVDDSGSFTVATTVEVDTKSLTEMPDGRRVQVLGQRTATGSSWGVWLEKGTKQEVQTNEDGSPVLDDNGQVVMRDVTVGRWHFGRLTADGTTTSVTSEEEAALDTEVNLVGAYDARTRQITLYVGADPQGDPLAYTASAGIGEFAVGMGWTNSAWSHYLPGRITDIRLWAGAMTDAAQVESVVGH